MQNLTNWFDIFSSKCWYFYVVYDGRPTGRFVYTNKSLKTSLFNEMDKNKAVWNTIKIIKAIKIIENTNIEQHIGQYIKNMLSDILTEEELLGKPFNLVKVFKDEKFLKFLGTDFNTINNSMVSYTSSRPNDDIWSIFEFGISFRYNYRDDRVVFLNGMKESDFKHIDGIGKKLAEQLLSRQPFESLEDIKIKGIGQAKYKNILDYVKFHLHQEVSEHKSDRT